MSREGTRPPENAPEYVQGWTRPTEIFWEFPRPMPVSDAVALTVAEAIAKWPEVREAQPLSEVIELSQLDNLFKLPASESVRPHPTTEFRFQNCDVTVLYGHTIRVIINRH